MNYFVVKKSFTIVVDDQIVEIPESSLITLNSEGTYSIRHHKISEDLKVSRAFVIENSNWIKQIDGIAWERANNLDQLIRFIRERRIDPIQAIKFISDNWPASTLLHSKSNTDSPYWFRNSTFTQL